MPLIPTEFYETATAQVLIADGKAWKRRCPVKLFNGLIDYLDPLPRARALEEEYRVGQKISPEIYHGLFSLAEDGQLKSEIRPGEELVLCMEYLPEACRADRVLARQKKQSSVTAIVKLLAMECALFHARCERADDPEYRLIATVRAWRAVFDALPLYHSRCPLKPSERSELLRTTNRWLRRSGYDLLYERAREGRVVEGHGDLHLKHVYLGPKLGKNRRWAVIDPLEFSRDLRLMDVGAEVGFLAMDMASIGHENASKLLVDSYAQATHDSSLLLVINFFCRYRAMVRGAVAWFRAHNVSDATEAEAQIALAKRYFEQALAYQLSE
jgi:aminoglycoside phosphotransferase family enzyme